MVNWDAKIWSAPAIERARDLNVGNISGIYYEGLTYMGERTKVFAYLGLPSSASVFEPVPAVVLAHGGGGTAFAKWVKVWNDKGYAAIAMDLEGNRPSIPGGEGRERYSGGGPARPDFFNDIHSSVPEQWIYHAVANVIIAHSLLRADPRVDCMRVGLTGISWGGIVTSIVIGVDSRFAFAVPVYGSGFLLGQQSRLSLEFNRNPKAIFWEPSQWLKRASMPCFG